MKNESEFVASITRLWKKIGARIKKREPKKNDSLLRYFKKFSSN